jgi:ABC-type transporter Mla maintaining outer membrane lipid asymmetry ATPase subunit MlaF
MSSAFRIADRMAMLYKGTLIAVGTKEEFRVNPHPRIRQFLDRVPDQISDTAPVEAYFERYLEGKPV